MTEFKVDFRLCQELINTNVIKEGTLLTFIRLGKDLSGTLNVPSIEIMELVLIHNKNEKLILEGTSVETGRIFKIKPGNIYRIDGMKPKYVAAAYGFEVDGKKKPVKIDPITGEEIKRGRKRKKR